MQTADYDTTQLAMQASQDPSRDTSRLSVTFFLHPVQDEAATAKEGRPIFKDEEYITIRVPGDKDNIVSREVWPVDKARFARQYEQFKQGIAQVEQGTPLEAVPWITRSQVEEMKYFHVRTVEQLASLSDSNAAKHLGVQALKQKAKDFLTHAKESAGVTQMRLELDQRDTEISMLKKALEEQGAKIDQLSKQQNNRR